MFWKVSQNIEVNMECNIMCIKSINAMAAQDIYKNAEYMSSDNEIASNYRCRYWKNNE